MTKPIPIRKNKPFTIKEQARLWAKEAMEDSQNSEFEEPTGILCGDPNGLRKDSEYGFDAGDKERDKDE